MPHHSILRPVTALLLALAFGGSGCGGDDGDAGDAGTNGGGGSSGAGGGGGTTGYCGDATESLVTGSGTPANPAAPLTETPSAGSACGAVEREFAHEPPNHTPELCVEIDYSTNPPCTGTHYGTWAAYRVYDEPIPRGFWVHGLEHGAVTLTYSCTDCEAEVAVAEALLADVGPDPACVSRGQPTRRTLLAPDPRLDTRWAASSWGFTLTADCFEPEVFRAFIEAHRGHGLEDVCSDGLDVSEPP
ncbi:MAG TPA: DUF3105 domain-containing protein [Polyangiaceae bacterium]